MTPTANTIAIRFVFASDEYPEFVGSPYNDVIAIFVNGVNCANYNGRPVSVNSINADVNASLFIDNDTGTRNTEMDGLTVPLDCVASVTPNAPNHVTIVIADTADQIYDSAVFLAAGGIRSPGSGPVTNSNVIRAIEYYHAGFNHYFVTTIPNEITLLDQRHVRRLGAHRQGVQRVRAGNAPERSTSTASSAATLVSTLISTHFYTSNAPEAAGLKVNPRWVFEGTVFGLLPPAALCPAGTVALFRAYNRSMGGVPNHRFTDRPGRDATHGRCSAGSRRATTAWRGACRCSGHGRRRARGVCRAAKRGSAPRLRSRGRRRREHERACSSSPFVFALAAAQPASAIAAREAT